VSFKINSLKEAGSYKQSALVKWKKKEIKEHVIILYILYTVILTSIIIYG